MLVNIKPLSVSFTWKQLMKLSTTLKLGTALDYIYTQ